MKRRSQRSAPGIYHRRIAPSEIRLSKREGKSVLEGYASVFGSVNSFSERFHEGAFERSIEESNDSTGPKIVHLLHHDERLLFGMPSIGEDSTGFEFRTAPIGTAIADQGLVEMKAGALSGVSIGFSFRKGGATWHEKDEVLDVHDARVFEISSVRWGSDPNALGGIVERSRWAKRLYRDEHGCDCPSNENDDEPVQERGVQLSALLSDAVEAMVDEETPREEIIAGLADAAGIDTETVNQIISGDIDCPSTDHLGAFADFLGLSLEALTEALEADGCTSNEDEASQDEEIEIETEERSMLYQLVKRRYNASTPSKERSAIDALLLEMTQSTFKPVTKKRTKKKTKVNNFQTKFDDLLNSF
jgi:HK97 family phage prohead protease